MFLKALSRFLFFVTFIACTPFFSAQAQNTNPFVRPAELEGDIRFWQRVYTEAGTDGGYIHDEEDLSIVYEQLTFGSDVSTRARGKRIDDVKAKYAAMLRKFSRDEAPQTADEQRVHDLWPKNTSRATFNAAVERIRFQLGQSNRFKEGLIRSGQWQPQIRKIFADQGLPIELAVLPHVESSFNPYAYSKVGAAGMWQFMRGTGRRFLRIDGAVDERLDPYKSSVAAASFLQQNYSILKRWPLALTAYNHGAAGMRRAVTQLGTDDIAIIVRKYDSRSFGFASRNFYLAFLAALEIDSNPEKFFGPLKRDAADSSQIVVLPDFVPMPSLATAMGVSTDVLKRLNPSLLPAVWNGSRRVPRGFELRAPPTIDLSQALARVNSKERFDAQVKETQHRVGSGETLAVIASRYGVTQSRLADINNLKPPYRIRSGQVLDLPSSGSTAVVASVPAPVPTLTSVAPSPSPVVIIADKSASETQYTVRRGDTLSRIARRHKLNEEQLMALNNIQQRNSIYEGQVLALTIGEAAIAPIAPPITPSAATVAEAVKPEAVADVEEPTSRSEAEALGPTLVPGAQAAESADPSDYAVAKDGTVRVEATETLGHYAEWSNLTPTRLRQLNRMSRDRPLVLGRRIKLEFTRVTQEDFEVKRIAYHKQLQDLFFTQFRIAGSDVHKVKAGDSIWILSQKRYNVPIWLLRQYNPDVDLEALRPGTTIVIPQVQAVAGVPVP